MTPQPPSAPDWERSLLEKVALQAIQEQRRARQWGALFKLLWFILAFTILAAVLGWFGRPEKDASSGSMSLGRHTALVELEGVIGPESKASAERVIKGLNRAFKDANTAGVVLRINSPGGAVTASDIMYQDLVRFREKTHKPVVACLMDVAASGAYYLAAGADAVYAHPTTVTGSIGVIMSLYNEIGRAHV